MAILHLIFLLDFILLIAHSHPMQKVRPIVRKMEISMTIKCNAKRALQIQPNQMKQAVNLPNNKIFCSFLKACFDLEICFSIAMFFFLCSACSSAPVLLPLHKLRNWRHNSISQRQCMRYPVCLHLKLISKLAKNSLKLTQIQISLRFTNYCATNSTKCKFMGAESWCKTTAWKPHMLMLLSHWNILCVT